MWIFSALVNLIFGILLYILTDKFNFVANTIIFILIRIIAVIILGGEISFGIVFSIIISSLIVVFVAQRIRYNFEYETSVWYIVIVTIVYNLVGNLIGAFVSLLN